MNPSLLRAALLALLLCPGLGQAAETDLYQPDPDAEPLDLGALEVTGGLELSPQQEATLRLVRLGLSRSRSSDPADKDVMVCWFEENVGSRFTYLACARNGDLWAQADEARAAVGLLRGDAAVGTGAGEPGYGSILRTRRPVNRYVIERTLQQLAGGPAFDQEFVLRAAQGLSLPQDVPDDEELARFASVHRRLEARRAEADEAELLSLIEAGGLSLDRYNRIVELMGIYDSLRARYRALDAGDG